MHTYNLSHQMRQTAPEGSWYSLSGLHACALSYPSQLQVTTCPLSTSFNLLIQDS